MEFDWGDYHGGTALYLGIIAVALVTEGGDGWQVEFNPSWPARQRVERFEDRGAARAAVDAWARKWETELRQHYAQYNPRR
jgi:hypothetical protein